jgi:SAM-dependent methyltransferase
MQKFFDSQNNRLVFAGKKADKSFWEDHWDIEDIRHRVTSARKHSFVLGLTKKYLDSEDGPILEGGCGLGQNVYALQKNGFRCIGVDYAQKTVQKVNEVIPEIDVRYGDVRKLEFEDGYFVGYWSLGVIEHFYEGFNRITREISRVLAPGGYCFITFPFMSFFRRFKAAVNCYPSLPESFDPERDGFYQFVLDANKVTEELRSYHFELVHKVGFDAVKGIKDEISILKAFLQPVYDSPDVAAKFLRGFLNALFSTCFGHSVLTIFRNTK